MQMHDSDAGSAQPNPETEQFMQSPIGPFHGQQEKLHTSAIFECEPTSSTSRTQSGSAGSTTISHSGTQRVHALAEPRKSASSTRNRFVKVRLSPAEYSDLATRADAQGTTLCEHIRQQLLVVHETLDVQSEIRALRDQIGRDVPSESDNPLTLEAVLILRELAASRDTQILARVRAQMSAGRPA